MQLKRIVVYLFVLFFVLNTPAFAREWRVALCYGKNSTETDKQYRIAILKSAQRVFSSYDNQANTILKARQCVKEPDLACYANNEAIFCREEPFSQLARANAWLAAEQAFIYNSDEKHERSLLKTRYLTWSDAYLLAEAERYDDGKKLAEVGQRIAEKRGMSDEDIDSIYTLALDIHAHVNNEKNPDRMNLVLVSAISLYESSLDLAMAFLFGHESFHFNNNRCVIPDKSIIEDTGIWKTMKELQYQGGLFDSKNVLEVTEVKADRCGYRWLEHLGKDNKDCIKNNVMRAMSKQIALDLLAGPILLGVRGRLKNVDGEEKPVMKVVKGYLYPQTRLLLASATLRLNERNFPWNTKLCGKTAEAIVTIIQESVSQYTKSSGYVPDEILAELPKGVESAWNSNAWSQESFSCRN